MEQAVAIQRELGLRFMLADNLTGLAGVVRLLGDLEAAADHLSKALRMFADAGDMVSLFGATFALAGLENDCGRHARAARLMGAAERLREQTGGGAPELMRAWGDPEADLRAAWATTSTRAPGTRGTP